LAAHAQGHESSSEFNKGVVWGADGVRGGWLVCNEKRLRKVEEIKEVEQKWAPTISHKRSLEASRISGIAYFDGAMSW